MRPYLVDFIVEVHAAFALLPESLFLTINLLDRYYSRMVIQQQYYQLVGCAALLIAAKYVEKRGRPPPISRLKRMCCGLYSSDKLKLMEMHVLNTLEWAIGHPTVDFYIQFRAAEDRDDAGVEHMAVYLCEIALYHRDFVSTKPSIMARASLALARAILGRREDHHGTWTHPEIVTFHALSQHLAQPSPALSRKYATPNFSCVSETLAKCMTEQATMAQRAVSPPSPPNELAPKPSTIDSTPQKGCGAAVGSESCLTPPITPYGDHSGDAQIQRQVYAIHPPYRGTPTFLSSLPSTTRSDPTQTWFPRVDCYQNNECTMNYPPYRIVSPHEVRQDLLSMVDHCSKGCDYNREYSVWSCPGNVDLYPVCWFQDGLENADWLSMGVFREC